jgi:HK97 family phage major capsid protein
MRLGSARGSWNMTETKVENTPEKDFRGFAAGNYGREFRALPITGGAAPNAAPLADLGLYRQFIEIMDRLAPMRTVCAVDTFSTADIRYPQQATQVTVDDDTAEAAAFDAFEPTFGAKTPTPRKFAVQTSVTQEAVADSLFSLEDIVLRQQAEALAAAQNAAFMLGTGVAAGDDRLFADHSAAGGQLVTAASATAITVKEMVSGLTKLAGTGYFGRPGAFVVSPGVIEDLMANEDGNNRPILQAQANSTYSVESPFQIFGRPVYVASEGNAMTTGKFVASYVASGAARIADVQGINFLRDPYTKSATGEINLLASIRSGFAITEARGIVSYKLG